MNINDYLEMTHYVFKGGKCTESRMLVLECFTRDLCTIQHNDIYFDIFSDLYRYGKV